MRASVLTACAAIGIAAIVTGCSSSGSSTAPANNSDGGGVPAGYTRVGGTALGLSFAVPSNWVTVDLTTGSVAQATQRAGLSGFNQQQMVEMQGLQKLHGLAVFDVHSEQAAHFTTNLNAYCQASGMSQSGSAGVPFLKQNSTVQLRQLNGQNMSQQDMMIGGVPGIKTSYTVSSPSAGMVTAAQLAVLPKPGRGCVVTLAAKGQFPAAVLATVAKTAVFS